MAPAARHRPERLARPASRWTTTGTPSPGAAVRAAECTVELVKTALAARWLPEKVKQAIYRIKPLAGAIRAGLNSAAPDGLVDVRVAAGSLAGLHLCLDLKTEKDYWLGTYEPELQAAITDLVKPGMVVFDVGANIGDYSTAILDSFGQENLNLYCFEPSKAAFERLNLEIPPRRNIRH